ncbi:MAG: hypothetical protein KA296_13790 [Marinobacter sp.]|nr:hypothetical protein [Marinobacter sp.]
MNIQIRVNGQAILEGDVVELLLLRSFQGALNFHPPEGANIEIMACEQGYCLFSEETISYEDSE